MNGFTSSPGRSAFCAAALLLFGVACSTNKPVVPVEDNPPDVTVTVDGAMTHQTFFGFGATHLPLVYEGAGDVVDADLRAEAVTALYQTIGITTGNLEAGLLESPSGYTQRSNDNDDPFQVDWNGFQTLSADALREKLVNPAEPLGFRDYIAGLKINLKWVSPWLADIRRTDYPRYLDEAAEQVVAGWTYLRESLGLNPAYIMLFNEPLGGNRELDGGSIHELVDLVKRVGSRLAAAGFGDVRFVVPNEVNEWTSLAEATAILADPEARQYVGAIGYHPYPYDSPYASIERLLATSGQGTPDPERLDARRQLRDLARGYGLPLWMTEVSQGGVDPRSMDDIRGRAIHIHDEFVYADASAYFGMNNMWDSVSHRLHFGNDNLFSEEGTLVLIEDGPRVVHITGMGYAIRHYARWMERGAVRLEATSDDALVQVTAFRSAGRLVVVLINNTDTEQSVAIELRNTAVMGEITGEQSVAGSYGSDLTPFPPESGTSLLTRLPAESVTTLSAALAGP